MRPTTQLLNLSFGTVRRAEVAQYLHDAKESGDVVDNAATKMQRMSRHVSKGDLELEHRVVATDKSD
jgi:hypothetical protein